MNKAIFEYGIFYEHFSNTQFSYTGFSFQLTPIFFKKLFFIFN